jgi:hypothetical protein
MKFLCVACDEAMKLVETADGAGGESFTVMFCCPRCERRMALLINSRETQLVRNLGLTIGGRTMPPRPPERVPVSPAAAKLIWTEDAEQRLTRVPEFVRPMVRDSIERHARELGRREVTCEVMDEARSSIGM